MTVRVKVGVGLQVTWRREVQGNRMVFVTVLVALEVLVRLAVDEAVVFAEVVLDTTELPDPPPPPQLPTADTWSLMSDTPPERAYSPP